MSPRSRTHWNPILLREAPVDRGCLACPTVAGPGQEVFEQGGRSKAEEAAAAARRLEGLHPESDPE